MSPTILVIDDNPKIKESLSLAFPEYHFVGALSGEEGLKDLRKIHEIELIILDYKMSGLSGIEVLEKIRQMDAKMGVILLTSFGSRETVIEALKGHADDFIDKPYSIEQMKKKIEGFFEKRAEEEKYLRTNKNSMQRILRLVERNYQKSPTLKEAAEKASLSPKYLSRKFKQETSHSFNDYKVKLKMEQARKLLQETTFGVAQIAYKVGYDNAESFMKMFKKTLDCTPTEYRRRTLEKADISQMHRKDGG